MTTGESKNLWSSDPLPYVPSGATEPELYVEVAAIYQEIARTLAALGDLFLIPDRERTAAQRAAHRAGYRHLDRLTRAVFAVCGAIYALPSSPFSADVTTRAERIERYARTAMGAVLESGYAC